MQFDTTLSLRYEQLQNAWNICVQRIWRDGDGGVKPPNWWPKKSRVLKSVLINTVWIRPLNSTNNTKKNAKLVCLETSLYFLSVVLVLTTFHWLGYVWFVYRIFACHKMCSTSKKSLQPAFDWLRKWRVKFSTRVWHPQVITASTTTYPPLLSYPGCGLEFFMLLLQYFYIFWIPPHISQVVFCCVTKLAYPCCRLRNSEINTWPSFLHLWPYGPTKTSKNGCFRKTPGRPLLVQCIEKLSY